MADTFSLEEASAPANTNTFSLEDAVTPPDDKTFSLDDAVTPPKSPVLAPDFARNIQFQKQALAVKEMGGDIEPTTDFLSAITEDKGKQLPAFVAGAAMLPFNAAGKVAYATAADAVSKLFSEPEYGGNLKALKDNLPGEPLPAEKFISDAAKTNPKLATAADVGEGATEMAPALGLSFGGKALNRILAAGFSADMIATAPQTFKAYADEINKPEGEQDPGKIASLKADILQRFLFAPLAAKGAMESAPEPATVSPEANAEAVRRSLPPGFVPKQNYIRPGPPQAPEAIASPDAQSKTFSPAEALQPETPAAIRVPDNAPPPQVPEGWDIHPTDHGIYVYDPDRISPEDIEQALPAGTETPAPTKASVPVMITKQMEADLRARGLAQDDINKLTPQQANDILSKPPETPTPAAAAPETPLTVPPEPAKVAVAAPETITGPDARLGAAMPAETVRPVRSAAISRKPSRADTDRPFDIIDHIESNYGKIDPTLIKEANPDWKPVGAARKIFAKGGEPADVIADQAAHAGIYKGDPGQVDQLGDAINAAATARKGWRAQFYNQERAINQDARQESAFQRQANKPGKSKETLVPDTLNEGDEFELQGAKVKVKELHFDEFGEVEHVVLEDGKKFGTRQVEAGTVLHVDKGTVKQSPPNMEFLPGDPVESFLTKAIKATEHDSSQLMEGVTGAPVWMTKAAVNLTLKAALHTYRATKDLAQAVAGGLKWLRAQNLSGFDAQQAAEWLTQNLKGSPVQQDLGQVLGAATRDRKPIVAQRPDEWSTAKGTTTEPFLSDLHSAFTGEGFRQRTQAFSTWLGGLAGESFPRTTQAAREVGEQMARWISSRMAATPLADGLVDDVMNGLDLGDVEFGAMLHEDNLRSIKKNLEDRASVADKQGNPDAAFQLRQAAGKVFTFIGKAGPWKDEAAYQEYLKNPRVQEAVRRYVDLRDRLIEPMYREAMKLEPDLQLEPRGLQTGARINLNWVRPGELSGPDVFVSNPTPRGVLANVLTKRSPFGRIAKGTAAAYRPSFRDSIRNTYARQLEISNRNKFDRMLEQSGNAITGKPGERHTLHGEPAVPFEQRRMMTVRNTDGNIVRVPQSQNLYVRQSIAGEYRRALNLNSQIEDGAQVIGKFTKLSNSAALASLTELTAHISNLSHFLFLRPGVTRSLWSEIGLSTLGRADIGVSLFKAMQKFTAEDKVRIRDLSEIGAMREAHQPTGGGNWNPMNWGPKIIQALDTRTRLQGDRMFQNLVDQKLLVDTPTERREFVNQIGQYNRRAQGPVIRALRDSGLGPFATAGRAFNVLGVRTALLHPGAQSTSFGSRVALAATMASKLTGAMVLIGTLNYVLTKNKGGGVFGRPGVPLGAVDTGRNDKTGRPMTLPLGNLLGILRPARVTGVRGALEAARNNLPLGTVMDSAARDVINSWVSPAAGPVVRTATIAATGYQPAVNVPRTSPIVPPGKSQMAQNLTTALVNANPIVAGINDSRQPGASGYEWLQKQAGRFTLQPGKSPDMMANYAQIVDRAQAGQYMDDVIHRARAMAPDQRLKYIQDSINNLQDADKKRAWDTVKYKRVLSQ